MANAVGLGANGLDHLMVFGEAHLRRVLKAYAAYYNEVRTHCHCARTRQSSGAFNRSVRSRCCRCWAVCIINTFEFSLRRHTPRFGSQKSFEVDLHCLGIWDRSRSIGSCRTRIRPRSGRFKSSVT
jgi:hypothetical protein